jgi:hypothetical protein
VRIRVKLKINLKRNPLNFKSIQWNHLQAFPISCIVGKNKNICIKSQVYYFFGKIEIMGTIANILVVLFSISQVQFTHEYWVIFNYRNKMLKFALLLCSKKQTILILCLISFNIDTNFHVYVLFQTRDSCDTRQRTQLSRVRIRLPPESPERGQDKSQHVRRLCLSKKNVLFQYRNETVICICALFRYRNEILIWIRALFRYRNKILKWTCD